MVPAPRASPARPRKNQEEKNPGHITKTSGTWIPGSQKLGNFFTGDKIMKKVVILLLALSLAGAAFAAGPPASSPDQALCPVMGGKANPNIYADYQGQRVYFCCQGCPGLFQKDPGKHLNQRQEQQPAPNAGAAGK
jgi:YHS domain-containing protein